MKTINLITITLIICWAQPAQAQFLKKLKKAVEEVVEDKTIEKITDEAAKSIDKAFEDNNDNSSQDDSSESAPNSDSQSVDEDKIMGQFNDLMGGMMADVKTEEQYNFDVTITMEVADSRQKSSEMKQGYAENAMLTIHESSHSIFDFKNEGFIIIDQKEKKAQVMSMSWMKTMNVWGNEAPEKTSEKIPEFYG